jgi:hypothetical protein
MRKAMLLILFAISTAPGCCILKVHSPWLPLGSASKPASTTLVSDQSNRLASP